MHEKIDMEKTVSSLVNVLKPTAGIVLDFNCPRSSELISMSAANGCFNAKNKWLIFEDNVVMKTSRLINQLNKTDLYINTDISYVSFAMASLNESSK